MFSQGLHHGAGHLTRLRLAPSHYFAMCLEKLVKLLWQVGMREKCLSLFSFSIDLSSILL